MEKVREIDGVTDADTNFEPTQPELRINVDRAARGRPRRVASTRWRRTMRTLVGGEEVSKFKDGDEQFSVRLRLDEPFRNNPATMGDIFVPAAGGRMVARQRRRRTSTIGSAPGVDRSLQPDAADLGQRQPRSR